MAEDDVKLLLAKFSPFSMTCAIALREKCVQFQAIEENLQSKSELLLRSNPVYKQIPVLIHNGKPLSESLVILEYIEETWPPSDVRPSLLPDSPYERSLARFWADYANKKFIETGLKLMKRFGKEHETARKEVIEQFITLEEGMRAIGSEGPFFLGTGISLADLALAPLVPWMASFEALGDLKFPDADKCSRMHQWLAAMRERPSVVASVPHSDWLLHSSAKFRAWILKNLP
eukprot:Gb_25700 [translate_table: standard]